MITLPRRKFLTLTAGLIAAPVIVRASAIMPVSSLHTNRERLLALISEGELRSALAVAVADTGGGWVQVDYALADGRIARAQHPGLWDEPVGDIRDVTQEYGGIEHTSHIVNAIYPDILS